MLPPRVLVLDDDAAVRDSLQRALVRYGYRAAAAATLDAAAAVLEAGDIQALILDVRLQGAASGLDLLRTMRATGDHGRIPTLVVTGGVLTESEEATITQHGAFLFYKIEGYDSLLKFLDTLTGRDSEQ
jgi:two-component system, OmpR family, response regulator MprA